MTKLILLLVAFLSVASAQTQIDPVVVQAKTKSDLESGLSKLIAPEEFDVQVNVATNTRMERQLVEGESITQTRPSEPRVAVPPLPGFTTGPEPVEPSVQPAQSRNVYRMVEKTVLRNVAVQLTLDSALAKEQSDQAEAFVRNYVTTSFGGQGVVSIGRMKMRKVSEPAVSAPPPPDIASYLPWLLFGLTGLGLLALVAFLIYAVWRRARRARQMYPPTIDAQARDFSGFEPPSPHTRALAEPAGPSALPAEEDKDGRVKYLPLPASAGFAETRAELLGSLLKNADTFRLYYQRLSEAARTELYAALRGPAFDSLLESLELAVPEGGDTSMPPTEEQTLFYQKNFDEFITTYHWQKEQFFGFLQQLTHEQVMTLIKGQNPLVGALMIKFMKPKQSAAVMRDLPVDLRDGIIKQTARVRTVSTEELGEIERSVRDQVAALPSFILTSPSQELEFWARLLSNSEDQDAILLSLEKERPELYEQLAKYRFRLEDVPSLPRPLIHRVLDQINNDELTRAMLTLPEPTREFLLSELGPKRQALLRSQLDALVGLPAGETREAKQRLTTLFREVMA